MKKIRCALLMAGLLALTGCARAPGGPETVPAPAPQEQQEEVGDVAAPLSLTLTIGGQTFTATLADNEAARALIDSLPLTLDMSELNGNEKYAYLAQSLPTDATRPGQIQAGDLMLYGDSCLVLFYESFASGYSYTPLGRMDDGEGLAAVVGGGGVTVRFEVG